MKRHKILILTTIILGILLPSLSIIYANSHAENISDTSVSIEHLNQGNNTVELAEKEGLDFDPVITTDAKTPAANEAVEAPAEEIVEEPVVETVVEPEPVKTEPVNTTPVKTEPAKPATPVVQETAPQKQAEPVKPVTQPNHIEVAGRWVNVYDVNSTALDAGNSVYRFIDTAKNYNGNFYYGHNSSNVFGGLVNLVEGSTFTITINNVTTTYRVAKIQVFEKNQNTGKLQINGEGSYMNSVARAKFGGVQYSVSLMTCHGRSLGNGDATERLVIFANAI